MKVTLLSVEGNCGISNIKPAKINTVLMVISKALTWMAGVVVEGEAVN